MTRETSGCGEKKLNALGTEKTRGREGDRKRDKERERSYRRQKEGLWGKWIETDRCEQTGIVKGREKGAALDVLVNFCLSVLVKMPHINVQINGHLIFQPAPYCHHQMALLSYLLMTRAEFPPPSVSVYCELLLILCGLFNFALCSSDTTNPPTCSHQKGTGCIQNMVQG